MFQQLGLLASIVLEDVSERRRCNAPGRDKINDGEIERVAWLRATDQPRRIDASLMTENRDLYGVRGEGEERCRQAHLLARARRQGVLGK
jgi:hypothetical protein